MSKWYLFKSTKMASNLPQSVQMSVPHVPSAKPLKVHYVVLCLNKLNPLSRCLNDWKNWINTLTSTTHFHTVLLCWRLTEPATFSSIKHCSGDLQEQLVYWCFCQFWVRISPPKLHSAPLLTDSVLADNSCIKLLAILLAATGPDLLQPTHYFVVYCFCNTVHYL